MTLRSIIIMIIITVSTNLPPARLARRVDFPELSKPRRATVTSLLGQYESLLLFYKFNSLKHFYLEGAQERSVAEQPDLQFPMNKRFTMVH